MMSSVEDLCSLKNLRLADAPSQVRAITLSPHDSNRRTHPHTNEYSSSPETEVQGKETYRNSKFERMPDTIKVRMWVARCGLAICVESFSLNLERWSFISLILTKPKSSAEYLS